MSECNFPAVCYCELCDDSVRPHGDMWSESSSVYNYCECDMCDAWSVRQREIKRIEWDKQHPSVLKV